MIARSEPRFTPIDAVAFKARHRSTAANFLVRQACLFEQRSLGDAAFFPLVK